jgi:hypothetical protein
MARLALTKNNTLGSYPATPLAINTADVTFTPAGANFADGFSFDATGGDILLIKNGNAAPQTVTLQSMPDAFNRKGDISAYSVGAGEEAVFDFSQIAGWKQADGKVYGSVSAADVSLAVIHMIGR